MKNLSRFCLGVVVVGGCCSVNGGVPETTVLPAPNPAPIFESKGYIRTIPELETRSYTDKKDSNKQKTAACLLMQKKAVGVVGGFLGARVDYGTENRIKILGKNLPTWTIMWRGADPVSGKEGYPFEALTDEECRAAGVNPAKVTTDEATQTISYRKPYRLPDGKIAEFTYALRPAGKGQVQVQWNTNSGHPVQMFFTITSLSQLNKEFLRKNIVSYGGTKAVFTSAEEITANGRERKSSTFPNTGDFEVAWDTPLKGLKISGLGDMKCTLVEKTAKAGTTPFTYISFNFSPATQAKLLIDLGEAEVEGSLKSVPPVNGTALMKNNGIEYSLPPTRNELRNPSFEQGFRFWTDQGYGHSDEKEHFEISSDAKFGKRSLRLIGDESGRKVAPERRFSPLMSMPMPLLAGETYTLSFHAKSLPGKGRILATGIGSAQRAENRPGPHKWGNVQYLNVTPEWQRYSRTFTAGGSGFILQLRAGKDSDVLMDGIQLERGDTMTPYVSDPIEADLKTSNPVNQVVYGNPIDASFDFVGTPGTKADVKVTIHNFYHEVVHEETFSIALSDAGTATRKLSDKVNALGKGIFYVRVAYRVDGFPDYFRFQRFSVMTPLGNHHPTRMIPGFNTSQLERVNNGDELARRAMEWGFGSTSWGKVDSSKRSVQLQLKYNIQNVMHLVLDGMFRENILKAEDFPLVAKELKHHFPWVSAFCDYPLTPKQEKLIEDAVYEYLKDRDPATATVVTWSNEEEAYCKWVRTGNFAEYAKYQLACARGVKRANPKFQTAYSSGVSNIFEPKRKIVDNYLKAAQDAGFRYDAVCVHTYGAIDGGRVRGDLDHQLHEILAIMQKRGYGKDTPLYITECFNERYLNIPEWNAFGGDNYGYGVPGYAWGHFETLYTASALRYWIIVLKYWPQVPSANIWNSRLYLDYTLMPTPVCKAANTLGNLFPWATFVGDIRPGPDMHGYAFRLKDDSGIAALWATRREIDEGKWANPVMRVTFTQPVSFLDAMENPREVVPDKNGVSEFPLTYAPLFIKAKDPETLVKDLQNAEFVSETGKPVEAVFTPQADGNIALKLLNRLSKQLAGSIRIGDQEIPFDLPSLGTSSTVLKGMNQGCEPGRMYSRPFSYTITVGKKSRSMDWTMSYFYVPHVALKDGEVDWEAVPDLPIDNYDREHIKKLKGPNDIAARYRVAWDTEHLYLRVNVIDDNLFYNPIFWNIPFEEQKHPGLWSLDGCLELYVDGAADNQTKDPRNSTYDDNDYRYDFCRYKDNDEGRCAISPWRLADKQWIAGIGSPSSEEIRDKVNATFERTADGYIYTIILDKRYALPMTLEKGASCGFALNIQDYDSKGSGTRKIVGTGNIPGQHPLFDQRSWPLLIFK